MRRSEASCPSCHEPMLLLARAGREQVVVCRGCWLVMQGRPVLRESLEDEVVVWWVGVPVPPGRLAERWEELEEKDEELYRMLLLSLS